MTDIASIREAVTKSRERLVVAGGSSKEIAVMLGALTEAVLLLVEGEAKVELYPPEDSAGNFVYPDPSDGPYPNIPMPRREEVG